MTTTTPKEQTLQQRLDETARQHQWSKSMCSQAQQAVNALPSALASTVTPDEVSHVVAWWYRQGFAPATIQKRLVALKCMGLPVEGVKAPKDPRKLKWWLRQEEEARASWRLLTGDTDLPVAVEEALAAHIAWTTRTGLRVEETLRLRGESFNADFTEVTVPGLKTSSSQATLPIGPEAGNAARTILAAGFRDYNSLEQAWRVLRAHMGWPPEATLKSLRRSAARYLHYDLGMPLDLVRQYLRHEDIATTMGYLRLTGGVSTAEYRRYLK